MPHLEGEASMAESFLAMLGTTMPSRGPDRWQHRKVAKKFYYAKLQDHQVREHSLAYRIIDPERE